MQQQKVDVRPFLSTAESPDAWIRARLAAAGVPTRGEVAVPHGCRRAWRA